MGSKQVKREEFEISARGIIHKPTGATFTPHPNNPFSGTINKSQLGKLGKRGDDYSPYEVEEMMDRLWAEYVQANR
jgi:hypothetical protein